MSPKKENKGASRRNRKAFILRSKLDSIIQKINRIQIISFIFRLSLELSTEIKPPVQPLRIRYCLALSLFFFWKVMGSDMANIYRVGWCGLWIFLWDIYIFLHNWREGPSSVVKFACRRSQVQSLYLRVWQKKHPCLKPWRATGKQCRQYWPRWTNWHKKYRAASYVKLQKIRSL